jgi:trk system potassium uptake protein TrkH
MRNETLATLHYAVRPRVIAKYLGQLLRMLALLTLVPCVASVLFGDYAITRAYAMVIVAMLLLGWPLCRLTVPSQVQTNEALVVTALIFIIAPLGMTLPMLAAGLPFNDAFFEAVSGVTTTGLSTLADIENRPQTFLFGRAWMQWYGGLGVVVLSVALLMRHLVATRRLIEPSGEEGLVTTTRTYARTVLNAYVVITIIGVALLWPFSEHFTDALVHAMTAVSTGGFSNYNASIGGVPSVGFQLVVSMLSLAGAVALPLWVRAVRQGPRTLMNDPEPRWLIALALLWTTLLAWRLLDQGFTVPAALLHGFTLAASAQSTTGFATLPLTFLDPLALALLIMAMFIGGGVGSTAGGVKLLRLLILIEVAQLLLRRLGLPAHAVSEPRIGDKTLGGDEIGRALVLMLLFVAVIFLSWLPFLYYGYPPLQSLFEVVSATCTVGLSTGIVSSELPAVLKYTLCADMLLGRLELIAFLLLIFPPTWVGKRAPS